MDLTNITNILQWSDIGPQKKKKWFAYLSPHSNHSATEKTDAVDEIKKRKGTLPSALLKGFQKNPDPIYKIVDSLLLAEFHEFHESSGPLPNSDSPPFDMVPFDMVDILNKLPATMITQPIVKSKTTADFIQTLNKTRSCLHNTFEQSGIIRSHLMATPVERVAGVGPGVVEFTADNICELTSTADSLVKIVLFIKTVPKITNTDYSMHLLTMHAYMALHPEITHGFIVLPLQSDVIIVNHWPDRESFYKAICQHAQTLKKQKNAQPQLQNSISTDPNAPPVISSTTTVGPLEEDPTEKEKAIAVQLFIQAHSIGRHVSKAKTLFHTVNKMRSDIPYQIFISSPTSTKINIQSADLEAAGEWVRAHNLKVFIHAPYIINLAARFENNWNVHYLQETMKYGAALGASGVVVHVGKYVKQDAAVAIQTMRESIQQVLECVDPSCPLLLETPAGQGTEMLTDMVQFGEFIQTFQFPAAATTPATTTTKTPPMKKLGVCVDTCHVFACGYCPVEYIKYMNNQTTVQLVHYNDSNDLCGSCKDRHAFVGNGHIGMEKMAEVAGYCSEKGIPMIIE